ncbi:hypothetical protein BH24ACT12_BH24ACT12_01960 [soil metagenome]
MNGSLGVALSGFVRPAVDSSPRAADVWLGGSNTYAAFFLCAAVVRGATASLLNRSSSVERTWYGTA